MQALFTLPASKVCDVCGVGITQVERWRDGTEPVPYAVFQLLRFLACGIVPDGMGEFSGWQFAEGRFGLAGQRGNARWEEILYINDYRLDRSLTEKQADLIEILTKQRNFYRSQCSLEARAGLMLANICGNRPDQSF